MAISQEDLLKALKADLIVYKELIRETSAEMISNGFTSYPIFVAHVVPLGLGETIVDREEIGTTFSIRASTLEEFVQKGLIKSERTDLFKQSFRDPEKFMSVFLISERGGNVIFLPFDNESDEGEAKASKN